MTGLIYSEMTGQERLHATYKMKQSNYVSNTVHFLNQQKKIIPQKLTPNIYACVHKITFFVVNEFFFDVVQRRKKMFHMVTGGGHKCLSQSAV